MTKRLRRAEIRAPVAMRPKRLNHRVPRIVTSTRTVVRRMVRDPRLRGIRALEERVVTRAIVSVRRGQHTPIVLFPGARGRGVGLAVPGQQTETVVGSPAIRRRVGNVCDPVEVECDGPFIDGGAVLLKIQGGLRDDVDVAGEGDVVRAQLLQADGLVRYAVEAGEHEEVAVCVGAEDGGVDGPFGC
jgi:hypothetical protein